MKSRMALFLALILCLAFGMPAMAEVDDAQESEWLYEEDEYGEGELDDAALIASLNESDDGAPITQVNESEQDDLIAAMEVYSWFALQPLDYDEDAANKDGTMWRVLDERFNTPELMRNMLSAYFSEEIAEELWKSPVNPYVEIDGFLYTDGEGREIDPNIGETSIEVTENTELHILLTATVEYIEPQPDGAQVEAFEYERKLIDGEWKYIQFPFFW